MASEPRPLRLTPNRRRDLFLGGLLFAAALAAYFPAVRGGEILDDNVHITRPGLQSLDGLRRIWFEVGATQQYYPVLHTAFWMEHRLWGDRLAGYHLVNVLLHALAAVILVAVTRRLRLAGGWLAGFLFALHPVCVESVAWIAEQKNTLSTALSLGAALAYLGFEEDRRRARYGLALGLFVLALLGKTAVAPLPAILLVLVWWRRQRLEWRRDAAPLVPWFLLAGAVCVVTVSVERRLLAGVGGTYALAPVGRVLVAGRAFWFYLGKLLWPSRLTFYYPKWDVDSGAWRQALYPAAAAILAAALVWRARKDRGPLAAFLCYACALGPVMGIVGTEWFVSSYVADHLQYFAVPAALVPLAATAAAWAGRLDRGARRLATAAAVLGVASLALLAREQSGRYRDAVTFYRTAAELNPASLAAHVNLGSALAARPGRLDEAVPEFEKAIRLNPRIAIAHEEYGAALLQDPARRGQAVAELQTAVQLLPNRKSARDRLAFALSGIPGREAGAVVEYEASLQIDPSDPAIRNSLGQLLLRVPGRLAEAQAQFAEAVQLQPGFADAHDNRGIALERMGRAGDAISEFREAVRLDPGIAEAHVNLGLALVQTPGLVHEAQAEFEKAILLKPGLAEAHNGLGLVLAKQGRLDEAIPQFEEAVRLNPSFAGAHRNLGLTWARVPGRLTDAIAELRETLRLSPGDPEASQALAEEIQLSGEGR